MMKLWTVFVLSYFPMPTIIHVDSQRLIAFVVQIWFRKKGVYLVTNRIAYSPSLERGEFWEMF